MKWSDSQTVYLILLPISNIILLQYICKGVGRKAKEIHNLLKVTMIAEGWGVAKSENIVAVPPTSGHFLNIKKFDKDVFSKEDYKFDLTKIRYLERGDHRGDCYIFTKLGVIFASVDWEEEPWWARGDDEQANVVVDTNPLSPSLTYPLLRPENYIDDWNEIYEDDKLLSQGRIKEISDTHLIEFAWQAFESNLHLETTISEGRDGIKTENQLQGTLEEGGMMYFRKRKYKCGALCEHHRAAFEVVTSLAFDDINRCKWDEWRNPNKTTTSIFRADSDDNYTLVTMDGLWSGTPRGRYVISDMKYPPWPKGLWQGPISEVRAYVQREKAKREQREIDYFSDKDNQDRWNAGW